MSLTVSSFGGLNGYWGQYGNEPLRNYCDSGVEYVTLGFVNVAPENDPSGYPGTNFGGHCWAGTYKNEDDVPSNLLSECNSIKQDIPYCQERGVKVLLSIGGVYNPVGSDYKVTTEENGLNFADFLYKAFGPYDDAWNGPRPFDISATQHSAVDGFDFDIEADFDNKPYISMIEQLRDIDPSILITGAPQCPTNDPYFHMKEMINKAAFDALFIQFYNNPGCDAIDDPNVAWDKFNYDEWEAIVAGSRKSKNAKLYVGLPASTDAAGSGYISPQDLKDIVCDLKDKAHFGGISLWDLTRGATNVIDGKSYNEHALDALKYGCDPVPTSTTSSTVSSTTETSTTETSTTETSTTETSTTETSTSETSTSESSTIATSTSETTTEATEATGTTTAADSSTAISTTESVPTSHTFSTLSWSNTTITSTTSTGSGSEATNTGGSNSLTSDDGVVTTATTESTSMTTSVVYTTRVHTFTQCPPHVDNCPEGGYVTTKTVALYTTVCPVSEEHPKPTSTKAPSDETKTIYTTNVHTVTSCPPEVHNCPIGSVTTEVSSWYTTVVQVTETLSGKVHAPTGKGPAPPSHTGVHTGGEGDDEDCGENYDKDLEEQNTTTHATSTVYRTVMVPPATLATSTKPAVFTPKPKPSHGEKEQPSGVATPTGGCTGEGCPDNSPVPSDVSTIPVTAGASTLAVGLTGLVALAVFAL